MNDDDDDDDDDDDVGEASDEHQGDVYEPWGDDDDVYGFHGLHHAQNDQQHGSFFCFSFFCLVLPCFVLFCFSLRRRKAK